MLHLDLMDGVFVPNLSFGPPVVASLAGHTDLELDAHLMTTRPGLLYEDLHRAGVSRVSVHCEACLHLHRELMRIRSLGMSPGVALNPATPLSAIEEALSWVDFVLIMSVNPGFGGQKFIPESLDKIRRLRKSAPEMEIAVDGGVNTENAVELVRSGATTLVAGSSVFSYPDRRAAISDLRDSCLKGA